MLLTWRNKFRWNLNLKPTKFELFSHNLWVLLKHTYICSDVCVLCASYHLKIIEVFLRIDKLFTEWTTIPTSARSNDENDFYHPFYNGINEYVISIMIELFYARKNVIIHHQNISDCEWFWGLWISAECINILLLLLYVISHLWHNILNDKINLFMLIINKHTYTYIKLNRICVDPAYI